jgi:hypothetical protein
VLCELSCKLHKEHKADIWECKLQPYGQVFFLRQTAAAITNGYLDRKLHCVVVAILAEDHDKLAALNSCY